MREAIALLGTVSLFQLEAREPGFGTRALIELLNYRLNSPSPPDPGGL